MSSATYLAALANEIAFSRRQGSERSERAQTGVKTLVEQTRRQRRRPTGYFVPVGSRHRTREGGPECIRRRIATPGRRQGSIEERPDEASEPSFWKKDTPRHRPAVRSFEWGAGRVRSRVHPTREHVRRRGRGSRCARGEQLGRARDFDAFEWGEVTDEAQLSVIAMGASERLLRRRR